MFPGSLTKISRRIGYPKLIEAALPRLPNSLSKAVRRFHFKREIGRASRGVPPVLVYTAPKVASTTVTQALQAIEGQVVFQVHMISAASVRNLREGMRQRGLTRIRHDVLGLEDIARTIAAGVIGPRYPACPCIMSGGELSLSRSSTTGTVSRRICSASSPDRGL
jgi:hypothetical protein